MEKAEKDRKEKREKKREKKEKKMEKKEKKKEKKEKKERRKEEKEIKLKEGTATTSHGTDDGKKFKLISKLKETKADGKLQKGEDCENEQLERSGITEEFDQPVTSVEPCCLSDSTQSSKRKRSSPQLTHDHGEEALKLVILLYVVEFGLTCINLIWSFCETGPAIKIRLPLRNHEPE